MAATERATLEQIINWMGRMGLAAFDFSAAIDRCRIAIVSATKGRFAEGKSPDGTTWKPLRFARPGSKGADKPLRDKGLLAASVTSRGAQGNIDRRTPASLEWGTNLDRARIHQEGGTIVPRTAKSLAIPLTREAARVPGPRSFPRDLFFLPAHGRKLRGFLAENKTKGRGKKKLVEAVRQYALVSSVVIPARPFLGWDADLVEECGEIVAEHAGKAILEAPVKGGGGPQFAA